MKIRNLLCSLSLATFLSTAIASNSFAQLRAGVSKIEITPPSGGLMYGYAARGVNVSTGVNDPLYVRALVISDGAKKMAIVSLDLGAFYAENTRNVIALIPNTEKIDEVLLVATHSHSTPRFQDDFPSESAPWIRGAEAKIAQAIITASKNMEEVMISTGRGMVAEGFNRRLVKASGAVTMMWRNEERIPTGPLDYELGVVSLKGKNGPVALLVNFACHPVVFGPDNLEFSADYPGAIARYVEGEIGGEVFFLPGAQGDINPFEDKQPIHQGAFEQVERLGQAIGKEVVKVYSGLFDYEEEITLRFKKENIPLAHRDDINRDSVAFIAEINTVLIGEDLALSTFPGEFFVEHGLSLKERSPFKHTFFVGYTNDALLYFPTIQSTTEGGYGAARRTQVEVGAGERLVNRALINLLYLDNRIATE